LAKPETLPMDREVLAFLNLKPVVIVTTVGRDRSTNAANRQNPYFPEISRKQYIIGFA